MLLPRDQVCESDEEGEEETKEVASDDVIKAATKFLTSSRFSRITLSKKPKDEEDVAEEEEMAVTKDAKDNVDICEWLVSRSQTKDSNVVMNNRSFICSPGINCFAMLFPFCK